VVQADTLKETLKTLQDEKANKSKVLDSLEAKLKILAKVCSKE
jgi:hypothetical protein